MQSRFMSITVILALCIGAAVAALLVFASTRPDTFSVKRTLRIDAPPERLLPLINDLRQFNRWNPFDKKDPAIRGSYRGPASGVGAGYDFEGNKQAGKGSLQIVGADPRKVAMTLAMVEPFKVHNTIEFLLMPQGQATDVTWAMHGSSPFVAKLVGVFMNMDRMVGRDFEAGLADLKALAERG